MPIPGLPSNGVSRWRHSPKPSSLPPQFVVQALESLLGKPGVLAVGDQLAFHPVDLLTASEIRAAISRGIEKTPVLVALDEVSEANCEAAHTPWIALSLYRYRVKYLSGLISTIRHSVCRAWGDDKGVAGV